ncbi:DEAD/DEAH box helicase [Anaerosinus massiliensis]|uniref:DEAD/DEAH box helicase n=1 Tax=Massilibacillus massiliensis TaxID=1806837 RepID=UPI000A557168|nr:DEAD/DEAH box helicase [Massilibacillus massiliensis]
MGKKFVELKVHETLCMVLKENGMIEATPVQEAAIPVIRSGKDVLVQAQTGTGKTLAFLLPIMEKIKVNAPAVQALIVTPTRELALQITAVAQKIGAAVGVRSLTVYGGQAVDRQMQKLEQKPHIIVGTPGRILDLARRKTLQLSSVNKVVLDEADQMLHMGFLDEVEDILKQTAGDRQTMFFSATIPERIKGMSHRYMKSPQDIHIQSENITLDEIEQVIIDTNEDTKLDQLCAMINEYQPYLAMVFCHTKQRVIDVTMGLAKRGYLVDELHGDLTQAKRTLVMRKFSTAKLQILVATDIAARGLDVEGVTHVFNYDIPHDVETYIHRIGRTGRAGDKGKAITFVNARQYNYLRLIEQGIKNRIHKQKATVKANQEKTAEPKEKQIKEKNPQKQEQVSLSRYANRKGAKHGGSNHRSRRKPKPTGTVEQSGRNKKRR